jgi:hypothetical protein
LHTEFAAHGLGAAGASYTARVLSHEHESPIALFGAHPEFASDIFRERLGVNLPPFAAILPAPADLTQTAPTEFRADLVLHLYEHPLVDAPVTPGPSETSARTRGGKSDPPLAAAIIIESQTSVDEEKPYSWPAYVANLRAKRRCPVYLLVVTRDNAVARWAATPIPLDHRNSYTPLVLSPSAIPVITDEAEAAADPELAVLSAIAWGDSPDRRLALQIATAAVRAAATLDGQRSRLYFEIVTFALPEDAREEFRTMAVTWEYQTEFAKKYVAEGREEGLKQGREEGMEKGRADLLARLLTLRFGELPDAVLKRLATSSIEQLDAIGERLLSAESLKDVFPARSKRSR